MDTQRIPLKRQRYLAAWLVLVLSALYLISTTIWVLKEPPVVLIIMEILTILSALTVLLYFSILYQQTEDDKHYIALTALLLAVAMATVTTSNHFVYMTVITPTYGTLGNTPVFLRLDGWPSVTKSLECGSWGGMLGLSMVMLSLALKKEERGTIWILRISGIMILVGLIGPFSGRMGFYFFSTVGYTVGLLVLGVHDIWVGMKKTT